ncbi:phage holin family protein [Pedobacter sp. SAFR-022]|uniref:phage holin family protein n=1 Tax=Pedobacter sp. SAFR-022 TaxID=3436861 RepID=UPI003F7E16BC
MQENQEKTLEELYADAKVYLETRVEYTRFYLLEKTSKLVADIITNTFMIICFILAFLFAIITLALFLSELIGSYAAGFGIVTLLLVLIAVVVMLAKEKVETAVINIAIKKYFTKLADKEDEEKV